MLSSDCDKEISCFDLKALWEAWPEQPDFARVDPDQEDLEGADEVCPTDEESASENRRIKLHIFRSIINYCEPQRPQKYGDLLEDLHSPAVAKFNLQKRLGRAIEGKTAANDRFKKGDWVGAMYTYAVAWGMIVPYYPEALPHDDAARDELGKLEAALFSNMCAMAVTGVKSSGGKKADQVLHRIGLDAAEICINSPYVSVGVVSKSCRRARELLESMSAQKGQGSEDEFVKDTIRFFTEQEALLEGVPADLAFAELDESKIATPVQVGKGAERRGKQG